MSASRSACAFVVAAAVAFSNVRSIAAPAAAAGVVTFAGTGEAGNVDGSLARATFSAPAGIAVAPNGDVYVADRSLDTIRLIHDGTVRTIVGTAAGDPTWRPGGYRDGPAAVAAIRHPESIAVAPDGSLVIADTWNACLRRYRDGVVTTIAGAPDRWGYADGPGATARLKNPMAIAIDARGTIYVSDYENPIRKVDSNGTVTTLAFKPTGYVFGIATAANDRLFVSDESGLVEMRTSGGAPDVRLSASADLRVHETTEAGAPLGHPYALGALDDRTVGYTDLFDDSIHEAHVTRVERIAGAPAADPNEAGGYRNGAPLDALFNAPVGLARYRDGWLVADMGNHRIRFVPGIDERDAVRVGGADNAGNYIDRRRPPVVLIGDSEVWTDTRFADSIAGKLQTLVPESAIVPVTLPGLDDPDLIGNWLSNYLELDGTYTVVYLFDSAGVTGHDTTPYATLAAGGAWTTTLQKKFESLRAQCGAARLIVADIPIGLEASPGEALVAQRIAFSDSSEWPHINAVHALIADAVRKSGVAYTDFWPAFRAIDAAGGGPLYHQLDGHLAATGRARLADLIAERLRSPR